MNDIAIETTIFAGTQLQSQPIIEQYEPQPHHNENADQGGSPSGRTGNRTIAIHEAEPEFHFIAFHIAQVVITRQAQCVFPMFWYESLAYIVLYARADYLGPHRP